MNLGSVCQTRAKGPEHMPMVLLRCTAEHRLVSLPRQDSTGGWHQSRRSSFCTSPHLPGLQGTYHRSTGFVLYFDINVCNMFCSFLAHPDMKITWLMCSGRAPPNSAWWHQCMWEDKQDLSRNGDTGYMGYLMSQVRWLFLFSDCPGRLEFCQSRLTARHPQNIVPSRGMDWAVTQ